MSAAPVTRGAGSARTAFITGASSGIGQALARHYAARGVTLGLLARRLGQLEALRRELPGTHFVYPADVTDAPSLDAAAHDFISHSGVPDMVIANAGVSAGTLTEHPDDLVAFRRILAVNVVGMVATFSPFVGPMRAAGRGRLVGIASVAGIRGLPGVGGYNASKAAAITYLESLRLELRGSGVRVLTLCPGYVETSMTAQNPYPMPFRMPVDVAARRIARLIEAGRSYAVVPWQMAIVAKVLRLLPNPVFDLAFSRAGRKPRGLDL